MSAEAILQAIETQLPSAPLAQIADIIRKDWPKINPHAAPYLRAMFQLKDMSSMYGQDDAKGIILYFLCNASGWRGPIAKLVKAELKRRSEVK